MVTCKLWGRLGNQMFMIATTIGYAKKYGLEYHIPPVSMNPRIWKTYFPHLVNHGYKKHLPVIQIHEQGHAYQELEFKEEWRNCNIELIGYWQSEKYFKNYREELLDAFLIVGHTKNWCSIHVRRGDYLKYPDKHPVMPLQYYNVAMGRIPFDSKFLVFSDDIEWCKKNFKGSEFIFSENNREQLDLLLMLNSRDNIIANSTFSWWAAWLNDNPDKIVIAPKVWFGSGNSHLDTKDIIPESWITL